VDALTFLAKPPKRQPVYALIGDEDFLKRRVREEIVAAALGDTDPAFAVAAYAGDKLDFSTVRNDLETLPFLSPCRIVMIDGADHKPAPNAESFLTKQRAALEAYVAKPSPTNILILDVKSFPETTKLAKALPDAAKVSCKAPYANKLPAWAAEWAKTGHGKKLATDAAEVLVELVGPSMGMLDQELEKLAVAVGKAPAITAEDVVKLVGRSRSADVFRIMDAVGEGKPAAAIAILEDLFAEGEDPMAILGPLTWQLRQLAAIGRSLGEGQALGPAMDAAKVPRFRREGYEKQVRWLGRRRLDRLTEWLVEINLGLKGGNALPERVQVERLIVKLARPRGDVSPTRERGTG
jgi:DNA polymerase-3 subunit delta